MEFTKQDMKFLKGVAILMMLLLHLFCRKEVNGLYETFPTLNGVPLIYYLALFGDACVPIYCFASGYGLYVSFNQEQQSFVRNNYKRLFKLMINYWIVLVLFIAIGYFAGESGVFPGSVKEFFLNFFVLSHSYNGAWWFLQTYLILTLISPLLIKLIKKNSSISVLLTSGVIYFISYIQRIKEVIDLGDHTVLNMVVTGMVLVGTSQLPFIVGFIFAKEKIYSRIYHKFFKMSFKNTLCSIGILLLIAIHGVYESMIIAPITAIAFVCLFNLMDKSIWTQKVLNFLGNHSTNIWLTHMFFYLLIFPDLTFAPRYPILIFGWLIILCLISSYVIHAIYQPMIRFMDKRVANELYDGRTIRG